MIGTEFLNKADRSRKKSYKGVLNKTDLAESYKCEKKSRRVSHGDRSTLSPPVMAVQFKEARIEEFLNCHDQQGQIQKNSSTPTVHKNLNEVIRRISTVEGPTNNNNNNHTLQHKPRSPHGETTPMGYEPENSLRRVRKPTSSSLSPSPSSPSSTNTSSELSYDNSGGLRKPLKSSPITQSTGHTQDYEPEGSLKRISRSRETSSQSDASVYEPNNARRQKLKMESGTESALNTRRRRSGAGLLSPEATNGKLSGRRTRLSLPAFPQVVTSSLMVSPCTPRSPLTSIIQEEPSPPSVRSRPSHHKLAASPTASPAISRRTPRLPHSPSIPRMRSGLTLADGIISRQDSASSKISVINQTPRHTNSARYWCWLLHNSTYSWKSFNTDKTYCY